jgi:polyribonucleotide nucleotidyltransferase
VSDVLKEGEEIQVKVLEIDRSGKIRLSRKEVVQETGPNGPPDSRPNS